MRLSYRVGSAALVILAIFLIKRQLDLLQDDARVHAPWQGLKSAPPTQLQSPENNVVGSSNAEVPVVPSVVDNKNKEPSKDFIAVSGAHPAKLNYEITPIVVPNDRVIVMARLSIEDTAWVSIELGEWRNYIYTVDDPNAYRHTPVNKGRESLAYLQYIIEHYHDLPSTLVFLHSHRDGLPNAWHTDTMDFSNVQAIRNLQTDFIQQTGFTSLRCQLIPGCPEEIRPFRDPPHSNERAYAQAWVELFNDSEMPDVIAAPCCSQFAVSRDQVLKRPLSDYQRYYNWVLETNLPDDVTSWVMEFSWHIIFGKDPVYCPETNQCYQDVYGNALFY